ncbi:GNAT family N-acetyltransferase, partial [Treponema sp. OttesenSCG-928-L16]|nr:GNAT family N-acetyltransferase [Treponema sp. OttesenSCG-928-L16]
MSSVPLRYTPSGHIFIGPEDDPDAIVRGMIKSGYDEEFCIALEFDPSFIARLMAAGFLVMSMEAGNPGSSVPKEGDYILLPKMHLNRSLLFFPDLHVGKTIRRLCPRYELKCDTDFDAVLAACVQTHGEDWLTSPLQEALQQIARGNGLPARLKSFALYREGRLMAGEFGISAGRVYTSYSGFRRENSAGSVQMALSAAWLRDAGFAFWDLGMPLDYKYRLGARDIKREKFIE